LGEGGTREIKPPVMGLVERGLPPRGTGPSTLHPMPDPSQKHALNVPGSYYNDASCIDCDLCREMAPAIFRRDDADGSTYVWRQPASAADRALAEDARLSCPTESIGNDG
jgi:ferredoxin